MLSVACAYGKTTLHRVKKLCNGITFHIRATRGEVRVASHLVGRSARGEVYDGHCGVGGRAHRANAIPRVLVAVRVAISTAIAFVVEIRIVHRAISVYGV